MAALTIRQHIIEALRVTRYSSKDLAAFLGISERHVEEHLLHVARTVAREPGVRFILEPAACEECGYVFRRRSRVTRPGRCPCCRSERISAPRYGIEQP